MDPEELARYRLKRVLGRGARPGIGGEVWEAEDTEHPRRVALKILRIDDEELLTTQAHFVREAQSLARLRHPNVVGVRDAGEAGGTSFVVMEFVDGKPLATKIAEESCTPEQKLRWLREIALALVALHEIDVVHRDVKAQNVLVRADGSACLVDLGVPFDPGGGADDPLDDQAAWAALAETVLGDDVPEAVAAVVARAGSPERDARFASMKEITAALAGDTPAAVAEPPAEREKPRVRRTLSPWVAVVALGILIALAALVQRLLLD